MSTSDSSLTLPTAKAGPGLSRKTSSMTKTNSTTSDYSDRPDKDLPVRDSHTARLKSILDEPAHRSLFREFLKANFCEENLTFWLDVQDFKRRLNTTSSAVATPGAGQGARTAGQQAMEKHQQDLIAMALVIYNSEPFRHPNIMFGSNGPRLPLTRFTARIEHRSLLTSRIDLIYE